MKPLYVKKNGIVYKISGNGMPALYPAENVEYDNTVTSELQATDVQGAIDELSTRQGGVQSDWNEDDSAELDYIKNKPENLVQDANYVHTDNNYDATAKNKVDSLGTASTKDVGVANGIAELDAAGKVPSSQLPSFVDDVIEVADYDHLPITGESGKIYVTLDTNKTYRWTGSGYAEISESLALGETSSTAYRGDKGKQNADNIAAIQGSIGNLSSIKIGVCDTAANVKDKVVTIGDGTSWQPKAGDMVGVKFTNANTYSSSTTSPITLSVNGVKANIWYNNTHSGAGNAGTGPSIYGGRTGVYIYYVYDGTYWVWINEGRQDGNNYPSVAVYTNADQQVKVGTCNYYVLTNKSHCHFIFRYSNTYNGKLQMNINNTGAKDIYINGEISSSSNKTLPAGTYIAYYENDKWYFRTDGKLTANITGNAATVNSNNTILSTDKTPFLTRQTLNPTGFSGYVREKLIGASYAWNQLLTNGDFSNGTNTWTARQGSVSVSGGIATVTPSSEGTQRGITGVTNQMSIIAGHKYLLSAWIKPPINGSASCGLDTGSTTQSVTANTWNFVANIVNAESGVTRFYCLFAESVTTSQIIQYKNCQTIDLTLTFGSTIADYLYSLTNNGGITKLRNMGCPIDKYTPYGNYLISSKTSGKKIVGFNVWDEEWRLGKYNQSTGAYTSDNSQICNVNKIKVLGGKTYYASVPTNKRFDYYEYDANDNFIKFTATLGGTFTLGENTAYINFTMGSAYGTTYSNDICINISDTNKNGQYEPYCGYEISLGNDDLRGKFDLVNGEIVASGDVKESNGEITRVRGSVELNSLTYTRGSFGSNYVFTSSISDIVNGKEFNLISAKYTVTASTATGWNHLQNMEIAHLSERNIGIRDDSYTDATTFKNSLSGIYLEYELATPTTEQSTPFADPMSMVGATTEEYIDARDIPCPVGAERQYMGQSEDVVKIPSSPQSDGKRVLISEVSGGKEQVYWDIPKLYYKEYTVTGDGTTTWGDLLASLKPIYESLSEDEKTYSKLIFRPESTSGNECLSYCGAYWYSRMGLQSNGSLWIDHASLGPASNYYYYQKNGDTFIDKTSETTRYSLSLRVFVEIGNNS